MTKNISAVTINGESVDDLIAGVNLHPGDDVQEALDYAAAHFLPGADGATVFLEIGEYPETSLMLPSGVNIAAFQPGATFPNLVKFGFKDATNGSGSYVITNIKLTVNNSNTDSIVEMPTTNTSTYIQMSGVSNITTSSSTAPLVAWNRPSSLDINLRSGSSLTMTDLTKTAFFASTGTVNLNALFGSVINGKIDFNGDVLGMLVVGGTLNAGSINNTSLSVTTSEQFTFANDYSTIIGKHVISSNTSESGVLLDAGTDQLILPTTTFHKEVQESKDDGDVTYSADNIVGGIIVRSGLTNDRSDTLPSATNLLSAVPNAFEGTTIVCKILNTSGSQINLSAGTGGSIVGNATLFAGSSKMVYVRFTSVGNTPAYVAYT